MGRKTHSDSLIAENTDALNLSSKGLKIIVDLSKTILFFFLFWLFIYVTEQKEFEYIDVWIWVLAVLYFLETLLEVYYISKKEQKDFKKSMIVFVFLSIIAYIVCSYGWETFGLPQFEFIEFGQYMVLVIVAITIAKIFVDILYGDLNLADIRETGYSSPFSSSSEESEEEYIASRMGAEVYSATDQAPFSLRIKSALNKSKYQLTFLLASLGVFMLVGGFYMENSWIYDYLIPILLVIPLAVIMIMDLSAKPTKEGEGKKTFKSLNIMQYIIEMVIASVVFLLCLFVFWDLMPEGFKEFGYSNWIIFSILLGLGVMVIAHVVLSRDTFRAFFKAKVSGEETDSVLFNLHKKERLMMIEIILVVMLGYSGMWISRSILNLLAMEGIFVLNILLIIGGMSLFIITLAQAQYQYAEYMVEVQKMKEKSVRRYISVLGLIYALAILISIATYLWYPSIDVIVIITYASAIIMALILLDVAMTPRSKMSQSTDAMPKAGAISLIALILGGVLVGLGLYQLIAKQVDLSMTLVILWIFAVIFGGIALVYGIASLIMNRKPKVKESTDAETSKMGIILSIVAGIAVIGLAIYLTIAYPFDITSLYSIMAILCYAIGGMVVILTIIKKPSLSDEEEEVKEEKGDGRSKKKKKIQKADSESIKYVKMDISSNDLSLSVPKNVKIKPSKGGNTYFLNK